MCTGGFQSDSTSLWRVSKVIMSSDNAKSPSMDCPNHHGVKSIDFSAENNFISSAGKIMHINDTK